MSLKTCTCKNCGHVYISKRIRPFCNNLCRQTFMSANPITSDNNPPHAILIGANEYDQSNTHNSR